MGSLGLESVQAQQNESRRSFRLSSHLFSARLQLSMLLYMDDPVQLQHLWLRLVTHDGDWCYYWDSNEVCSPLKHEHCNAFTTMQDFGRWDMNKDGTISASEAWEYGNLTIPEFLKADKDQDGFIIPSEFDSDLA